MRILHIDTGREMRGGQHQVKLLLGGLQKRGHESVLLARPGSALAHWGGEAGYPVYPAQLREVWQCSRKIDIVHAHDARAHTLAAVGAQKRFVVSRRVSFPLQRSFVSRLKYGRASRYLAVSNFAAGQLQEAGIPPNRIDVIYDAAEPDIPFLSWDQHGPAIAPAFRNEPGKLSELTAEACRLAELELVLSQRLLQELPNASVFIYLTRSEGLGSAALLAMAAGVPVIASRVEGLAEIFEHEISGLYVDNYAPHVAAAIRRIKEEDGLAQRLRAAARARVNERFTCDRMVENTLQSYGRALAC